MRPTSITMGTDPLFCQTELPAMVSTTSTDDRRHACLHALHDQR